MFDRFLNTPMKMCICFFIYLCFKQSSITFSSKIWKYIYLCISAHCKTFPLDWRFYNFQKQRRCSSKIVFLKICKTHKETTGAGNFIKKGTPAQVCSCIFSEILKKIFLHNTSGRLLLLIDDSIILSKKSKSASRNRNGATNKYAGLNNI